MFGEGDGGGRKERGRTRMRTTVFYTKYIYMVEKEDGYARGHRNNPATLV